MNVSRHHSHSTRDGSVLAEFMLVFPAFLVISMFVVETALMWVDKHIMKLAAFEAARVYASGTLPEWEPSGHPESNPCEADQISRSARQAALRRMAIVSPSVSYFKARMGRLGQWIDISPITNLTAHLPGPARRLVLRWPTAAASTGISCTWDQETGNIAIELTYLRAPETPFAGEVFWAMHNLLQLAGPGGQPLYQMDLNFFGIVPGPAANLAAENFRTKIKDSINTIASLGMGLHEAASFLAGIPGMNSFLGLNQGMPVSILGSVSNAKNGANAAIDAIDISDVTRKVGQILTSALYAAPEALRRIPMRATVHLNRHIYSDRAESSGSGLTEPAWRGRIDAVMELSGDYRTWAKSMSTNHDGMVDKDN